MSKRFSRMDDDRPVQMAEPVRMMVPAEMIPPAASLPAMQAPAIQRPAPPQVDRLTPQMAMEHAAQLRKLQLEQADAAAVALVADRLAEFARQHGPECHAQAIEISFRRLHHLRKEGAYAGVSTHMEGAMMRSLGMGQGGKSRLLAFKTAGRTLWNRERIITEMCHYEVTRGQWVGCTTVGRRVVDLEMTYPERYDLKRALQDEGWDVVEGWPAPRTPPAWTWQTTAASRVLARIGYNAPLVRTVEGVKRHLWESARNAEQEKVEHLKRVTIPRLAWSAVKAARAPLIVAAVLGTIIAANLAGYI